MKRNKLHKPPSKRSHQGKEKTSIDHHDREWAEHRCTCGYDVMFPWWCPYVVTMVIMVVRVNYVIDRRSWWILHPDEVYQSIEVGFSLVSGYGFRSYEYLPAPTNTNISIETQVLNSGMYGLRSFVLPYMFAGAIWMAKLVGCNWSSFLIGRVFNAVVTSTLPLAVFKFADVIFRCRLVAILACALTALSLHLAVLGTHPLVNSFLAPFIVFGLTLCLNSFSRAPSDISKQNRIQESNNKYSDINSNVVNENGDNETNCLNLENRRMSNGFNGNGYAQNGIRKSNTDTTILRRKLEGKQSNMDEKLQSNVTDQQHSWQLVDYCLSYIGGIILGLTAYIRPDSVLFISFTVVPLTMVSRVCTRTKMKAITSSFSGAISIVIVCVMDEFNNYGKFVFSPIQWFKFNVLSPKAGKIFGSDSLTSYLDVFLVDKSSFILFICAILVTFLISFIKPLHATSIKPFYALVTSFFGLLLVYSLVGHKEVRIIQNLFILQAIISAAAIHFTAFYLRSLHVRVKQSYVSFALFIIISLCASKSYQSFPSVDTTASDWSYKNPKESRDVNSCLDYIRHQDDVTGVMVNASVYNIGGYSVIEHDVPILVRVHQEYHLYETKNQNRLGVNNRIRVFTDFSDFIDIDNQPYVLKVIRDKNLNYIISQSANRKKFEHFGLEMVFQYDKYSVFKIDHTKSNDIKDGNQSIVISDSHILEYEANWLITNGLYTKAIWRINQALEVNRILRQKSRVRLYQLLMVCYSKMNRIREVKFYQDECFTIYGRTECVTPQEKIVRHEQYNHLS